MDNQVEKLGLRFMKHIGEILGPHYHLVLVADCEKDTYSIIKSEIPGIELCMDQPGFIKYAKKTIAERMAKEDIERYPLTADPKGLMIHLENNNGTYRIEAKDNNADPTWYEAIYKLIKDEDGYEYMLVLFNDITEKKRIEKSFMDARVATEIAIKAKSDFLSKMTEDLRSPINLMLSMIEMAQSNLQNPDIVNDCLLKMNVSAHYLFHVIDNAIDLASLQNGRFSIDNSPFNITELIEEVKESLAESAKEKNLFVEVLIHNNGLDSVVGDAYRLRQIVRNLVSNSIKHAEENGTVTIELLLNRIVSNRAIFSIIVENDGEQLAEEDFKNLFVAFGNGEDQNKSNTQHKGLGIGLAVCKNTVELLCGTIKATNSNSSKGVRFEVELSFELDEECVPQDIDLISDDAFIRFNDKTVMLVRDENDELENVKGILENYGIKVEEIFGGMSAISHFENSAVGTHDMIITKMDLADFSGANLTEAIRHSFYETGETVPIIGISGVNTEKETMEALNSGMNGFIQLPVDISKMFGILKSYLV